VYTEQATVVFESDSKRKEFQLDVFVVCEDTFKISDVYVRVNKAKGMFQLPHEPGETSPWLI
jgi:hypothetical protein